MTLENYTKWKMASIYIFFSIIIGVVLSIKAPLFEVFGVLLILSGYFGGLLIASKIGFDNKSLWMGLTFLFPYIMLPIMFFRKFENALNSQLIIEQTNRSKELELMKSKVYEIARLHQKSTLSSIMKSSRLSNEIINNQSYHNVLSALVLDDNTSIEIRRQGINILTAINNNEIVSEVMEKLRNGNNPALKGIIAELESTEEEKLATQSAINLLKITGCKKQLTF